MQRYRTLKIFLLFFLFFLVSNFLVLFDEAVVTGFLKYSFATSLIGKFFSKKYYLMPLFLSVAENIRKVFVGFEDNP